MNDLHIATELYDPAGLTGGVCPPGFTCAYADAAFAQWTGNGNYEFGMIHETEYWDSVSGSTNSLGANLEIISAQRLLVEPLTESPYKWFCQQSWSTLRNYFCSTSAFACLYHR